MYHMAFFMLEFNWKYIYDGSIYFIMQLGVTAWYEYDT